MTTSNTHARRFRFLAIAEGISYLLLAITVPLKYKMGIREPNMVVGMAHGILFIAYVLQCFLYAREQKWSWTRLFLAELASLLPFGTFWVEKRWIGKAAGVLALVFLGYGSAEAQNPESALPSPTRVDALLARVEKSQDTVYVVNFWATWCKPCVEELPVFGAVAKKWKGKPMKMLFVSLDFRKQWNTQLLSFIQRSPLPGELVLLESENPNEWINKVDAGWSGAIPMTLLYWGGKKQHVHEGSLNESLLMEALQPVARR